jgi:hypothetical protein
VDSLVDLVEEVSLLAFLFHLEVEEVSDHILPLTLMIYSDSSLVVHLLLEEVILHMPVTISGGQLFAAQ